MNIVIDWQHFTKGEDSVDYEEPEVNLIFLSDVAILKG